MASQRIITYGPQADTSISSQDIAHKNKTIHSFDESSFTFKFFRKIKITLEDWALQHLVCDGGVYLSKPHLLHSIKYSQYKARLAQDIKLFIIFDFIVCKPYFLFPAQVKLNIRKKMKC